MKTVLLLGGPAAGQRVEVHGAMNTWRTGGEAYRVVPMCSHGEVHWFGVLDGADPLALLIDGYSGPRQELVQEVRAFIAAPLSDPPSPPEPPPTRHVGAFGETDDSKRRTQTWYARSRKAKP